MQKLGLLERAYIVSVLCVATAITSPAQTFTTLHSFDGTDGLEPTSGLVQGSDGNFYGTTYFGGTSENCDNGCGTIFQVTPGGTLTSLHSFNGADGENPGFGLIQGSDGKFYGTATTTIFSIVPGGTPVILASVSGLSSGLAQGTDGNFYGTTGGTDGGTVSCSGNCGTVFKITPSGTLTTVYTFNGTNGYTPNSVVQGTDGNFYGTTEFGGSDNCGYGQPLSCSTLFKLTPSGTLTTLYSFCEQAGCPDGNSPSVLVQGTDGNFYGTSTAPLDKGADTVFKITPAGTLTTLYTFCEQAGCPDGSAPGGLVQGTDGNFYGTTRLGGSGSGPNCVGCGTIFKMTPQGTLITLYSFDETDGNGPDGLAITTNGTIFGTTGNGGASNDGTVFSLSLGIGGTTASTTSLNLSPASVTVGSAGPVVMTATVAPASGSGTPTGVVAFFNGSNEVGSTIMSGGVATYNYNPSSLALDTYQISAIYSGDGTFATSTSSPETLTISSLPAAATPSFSPAAGSYSSPQTVTITDSTTGATIYFTDDGTTPTTSSEVYNGPITVSSTETLKAIAASGSYLSSAVATATYTIGLSPDYNLSVTPSTLTIVAGQSGTAKFTVTPVNGFSSQVTFTCSGLPSEATCSFDPPSLTPSGSNPVSSTVTIITTAASAALRGPRLPSTYLTYALLIPCLGVIFGISTRRKRAFRGLRVFGMFALLTLAAGLTSCGSSSKEGNPGNPGNPGTPAGASTVTLTASTSGTDAVNHTAALTITITQ